MSDYLRIAKRHANVRSDLYFSDQRTQTVIALALLSIAESLERLVDYHIPACEDGYEEEEEEKC